MRVRKNNLCTPANMFSVPRVPPVLESIPDLLEDFVPQPADTPGLETELLRGRCACNDGVAEAADFLAQHPGFEPGRELDDRVPADEQIANAPKHLRSASREPRL